MYWKAILAAGAILFTGTIYTQTPDSETGASLTPADFYAVLPAGGSVVETKEVFIPQGLLPPSADVMFSFDVTGSMGGALDNVRFNTEAIIAELQAAMPGSRFGVMSHHDYPGFSACLAGGGAVCDYDPQWGWWVYGDPGSEDPEACHAAYDTGDWDAMVANCVCDGGSHPTFGWPLGGPCLPNPDYAYSLDQKLTGEWSSVDDAMWALPFGGGRDNPENYTRIMWEAYNDPLVTWREDPGVGKFLIMWVDHPPHDCDLTLGGKCGEGLLLPYPSTGPDPGRDELIETEDDLELLSVLLDLAAENITLMPFFVGPRGGETATSPRVLYADVWDCYADIAGGRTFLIEGDGTFPYGTAPAAVAQYILDAIKGGFGNMELTFGSPDPEFDAWLTGPDPIQVDLNDGDFSRSVDLTFQVPAGTPPGIYDFQACAFGDGVVLACQDVRIVVAPPEGSVTGGGWIVSPEGAFKPDLSATGKATFGFVSKYKKGQTVPEGSTEFQFHTAGLNFHSNTYDWLIVNQSGANAQFKGSGTINGEEGYKFMIWAGDGKPDTFRIKIWKEIDGAEVTYYDNGVQQALGGGSIVIHTK